MRRVASSLVAVGAAALTMLCLPAAAAAHGLSSRGDLPIPAWLYAWAAALVLAVSFIALAVLWKRPRLENAPEHPIVRVPVWLEAICGSIGVALTALLLYAGFAGTQTASENLVVTFVYVFLWAGLPFVCALLGDVFRPFNPWRAVGRACGWVTARVGARRWSSPLAYPDRLGRWPALVGLLAFGWLELVAPSGSDPSYLALAATGYIVLQLLGMGLFGVERWLDRGDALSVYFQLFGRIGPLAARDGTLVWRRPLAGLAELQWLPATVPFVCAMIGVTAFDGFMQGDAWRSLSDGLVDWLTALGLGAGNALQLAQTLGLLAAVGVVALIYRLGIWGMSGALIDMSPARLGQTFVASLVPIALAYVVAHYFSYVAFRGQGLIALASDPLGTGADLLGTADTKVDYSLISSNAIWYVQVVALVVGHMLALAVAHDKALAVFGNAKAAVRSQYWMLVVMIGFTNLGLWLLSVANR